jgi:predicted metalloprotease
MKSFDANSFMISARQQRGLLSGGNVSNYNANASFTELLSKYKMNEYTLQHMQNEWFLEETQVGTSLRFNWLQRPEQTNGYLPVEFVLIPNNGNLQVFTEMFYSQCRPSTPGVPGVGKNYINKTLGYCHFLLLCIAKRSDQYVLLGYLILNIKTVTAIKSILDDYAKALQGDNNEYKDVLLSFSNESLCKKQYNQPPTQNVSGLIFQKSFEYFQQQQKENDYCSNQPVAFVSIVCSRSGAGSKLLDIVDTQRFKAHLNNIKTKIAEKPDEYAPSLSSLKYFGSMYYRQISLESIDIDYIFRYYTTKKGFLSTIDCVNYLPLFQYTDNNQMFYRFSFFNQQERKVMVRYEYLLRSGSGIILSKFSPVTNDDLIQYNKFKLCGLRDINAITKEIVPTATCPTMNNSTPLSNVVSNVPETNGGSSRKKIILKSTNRAYIVHEDKKTTKKYIVVNKERQWLSSMPGKFRYQK